MTYIMALDQGTSSSRAVIYTDAGTVVALAQQEFTTITPQDGWVEQDPEEIWQSVLAVGREALQFAGLDATQIAAIGITNQRETTLLWDRATGRCLYNAIVWQDRRGAARCEWMATEQLFDGQSVDGAIREITGLVIDPYFSSTKLAWLLDTVPNGHARADSGELCFGTVDSFLIWRLTGGARHVTDATNASRTQLFDIRSQAWSQTLLDYFGIPETLLPKVLDSVADFGTIDPTWFGAAIPICGVAGDQQAALVGQGCFTPGMSKSTYGTGCFVMTHTGSQISRSQHNLLATVAYRINGEPQYALEGSIFVAGAAVKWMRDQLGVIDSAAATEVAYAQCGGDTGGVFVVPAFTGLGAPYWQPHVRGLITGLTLDSTRDQLVTAFVQSVVFQTHDLLQAMSADGALVDTLRIDGGMVVNDPFCQFMADLLDIAVQRPADIETTSRGAAVLAALGAGLLPDLPTAAQQWQLDREFTSDMDHAKREHALAGYAAALAQARLSA